MYRFVNHKLWYKSVRYTGLQFTCYLFWIRNITLVRLDFISRQIIFFLSKHQIKVSIGAFKIDCHCMKTEEHLYVNLIKFWPCKWSSKSKSTFSFYFLISFSWSGQGVTRQGQGDIHLLLLPVPGCSRFHPHVRLYGYAPHRGLTHATRGLLPASLKGPPEKWDNIQTNQLFNLVSLNILIEFQRVISRMLL